MGGWTADLGLQERGDGNACEYRAASTFCWDLFFNTTKNSSIYSILFYSILFSYLFRNPLSLPLTLNAKGRERGYLREENKEYNKRIEIKKPCKIRDCWRELRYQTNTE